MNYFFFQALEDMEFHQMEEAAHKETERDELRKEITEFEKQVENHETQLVEIDQQQKQLLSNVRQETECLEQQRKNISGELLKEKDKMKFLENRMEELRKQHLISMEQSEVDFLGETESEGESLSEQTRTCSELEASLSRLALLDKTQQEIDQISVATETMLQQSKFYQISYILFIISVQLYIFLIAFLKNIYVFLPLSKYDNGFKI